MIFFPQRSNIWVKSVVFGRFFILSQTRPTVFFGLCWYHIEMCRMAIYKNVMRQNFVFYPQRSNIGVKIVVFSRFFILSRTRPTVFIGLCWYHIELCKVAIWKKRNAADFFIFSSKGQILWENSCSFTKPGMVADPPSTDGLVLLSSE